MIRERETVETTSLKYLKQKGERKMELKASTIEELPPIQKVTLSAAEVKENSERGSHHDIYPGAWLTDRYFTPRVAEPRLFPCLDSEFDD